MTADLSSLPQLLANLYRTVKALEQLAPGRSFTPDGHLVGSIGEVVAAYAYDLELLPASTRGHDATAADGRRVQIKLTQGHRIAISYDCEHLLVLRFDQRDGFVEVYNGPGRPVWDLIEGKAAVGRQRPISLVRLRALPSSDAGLVRVRPFPPVMTRLIQDSMEAARADSAPAELQTGVTEFDAPTS